MRNDTVATTRRSLLKAGLAGAGAFAGAGAASAAAGDEGACAACYAPHEIGGVRVETAVPPLVSGSATLRQHCTRQRWAVRVRVGRTVVRETSVEFGCRDGPETVAFRFEPSPPLQPGTYELAVVVEGADARRDAVTTFDLPSNGR